MRWTFFILITILNAGFYSGIAEAAVTLPAEPIEERPAAINIPRDPAFPLSERLKNPEEIRIVALGDSGTGSPDQMTVARTLEKFCVEKGCDLGLLLGVSGAAGSGRPVEGPGPRALFVSAELGFPYLRIKKNELIVQMVSANGGLRYSLTIPRTHPEQ